MKVLLISLITLSASTVLAAGERELAYEFRNAQRLQANALERCLAGDNSSCECGPLASEVARRKKVVATIEQESSRSLYSSCIREGMVRVSLGANSVANESVDRSAEDKVFADCNSKREASIMTVQSELAGKYDVAVSNLEKATSVQSAVCQ